MKINKLSILVAIISLGINVNAQDLKGALNNAKDKAVETQTAKATEQINTAKDKAYETVADLNSKKENIQNQASDIESITDVTSSKLSGIGNLTNIVSSIKNNDLANKVTSTISSLSNASDKLAMAKSAFDTAKASGLLSSSAIAKKEAQITQITDKIAQIQSLISSTKGL